MSKRTAFTALAFAPLLACTPSTSLDGGPHDAGDAGGLINPPTDSGMPDIPTGDCPTTPPFVAHGEHASGGTETTVTACSGERWVGLDLETKTELLVDDDTPAGAWDLAFQRYHVMSNGGVSGSGGVRIAPLEGVDFDDVTEAPAEGYLEDESDSDLDGYDDFVISGQELSWWRYNLETHVIEMTGVVWVVESAEGNYYKLELTDYYEDQNGTAASGYPTFVWAPLAPPPGGDDAGPGDDDAGEGDAG